MAWGSSWVSGLPAAQRVALQRLSSTVADIFYAAALEPQGPVQWGTPVPETGQGVYAVALADDPESLDAALAGAPIDYDALEDLLAVRPELRVSLAQPDVGAIAERLSHFWLPDEVVLYIGLAGQGVSHARAAVLPNGARGEASARRWVVAEGLERARQSVGLLGGHGGLRARGEGDAAHVRRRCACGDAVRTTR